MKKLLIVAALALCLTALVSIGASGSGGNACPTCQVAPKATLPYVMAPGDSVSDSGVLSGLFQLGYRDVFVVVNRGPGTGTWSMEIEDCCITGDTMLALKIGQGGVEVGRATSPDVISLGPVSMPAPSWLIVITGYIDCPGGFDAGYYYDIWM